MAKAAEKEEAKKVKEREEKEKKVERSKTRKCLCKSEFQDQKYGPGMRVHRVTKKGEERCTVCFPDRRTSRMRTYVKIEATSAKYPFLFK